MTTSILMARTSLASSSILDLSRGPSQNASYSMKFRGPKLQCTDSQRTRTIPFEDLSAYQSYQIGQYSWLNATGRPISMYSMMHNDSTLIIDAMEHGLPAERRLAPTGAAEFARHQRIVGLALAACEKTVQIVYEHRLRPEEKRHQPWLDRVGQRARIYRTDAIRGCVLPDQCRVPTRRSRTVYSQTACLSSAQ